ncbi:hypothetical protein V1511DRAFT_497588 [Dipodascopsis uninucleata]
MASPDFIANPPDGFSALSIIRGLQLTFLGAYRALQNPELLKGKYYRQLVLALVISLVIQFIIYVPFWFLRTTITIVSWVKSDDTSDHHRKNQIMSSLVFLESQVVNLSGLLIGVMKYIRPELDDMFMQALRFIDIIYFQMHPEKAADAVLLDDKGNEIQLSVPSRFYTPLSMYPIDGAERLVPPPPSTIPGEGPNSKTRRGTRRASDKATVFVRRYLRRAFISTSVYLLSHTPYIGKLVLPLASFLSFRKTVGLTPAIVVFGAGLFIPKKWMIMFFASYWGTRSLTRELLSPYFNRIPFNTLQKDAWFRAREGVLFGFGFGFYHLLKIPFIGLLMYGIAEASTAYLVTKVTDPIPHPSKVFEWTTTQTKWSKRKEALGGSIIANEASLTYVSGTWVEKSSQIKST